MRKYVVVFLLILMVPLVWTDELDEILTDLETGYQQVKTSLTDLKTEMNLAKEYLNFLYNGLVTFNEVLTEQEKQLEEQKAVYDSLETQLDVLENTADAYRRRVNLLTIISIIGWAGAILGMIF